MFTIRLWLQPILLLVAGGLMLVIGSPYLHDRLIPPSEQSLKHSEQALRGFLTERAASAVTAAAQVASSGSVRRLVEGRQASASALEALIPEVPHVGKAPVAIVANSRGEVTAQVGGEAWGKSIGGIPAFAEALGGVQRDGYARIEKAGFLVATSPIYGAANRVSGGVLLAWKVDGSLLKSVQKALNVPAVIVDGSKVVAGAIDGLTPADIASVVSLEPVGELALDRLLSQPLLLGTAKRYVASKLSIFPEVDGPAICIAIDRVEAYDTIVAAQIWVFAALFLLVMLMAISVMSVLRSISKPMSVVMDHLSAYAQGSATGILPEAALSGPFVRLGKQINMILERGVSSRSLSGASVDGKSSQRHIMDFSDPDLDPASESSSQNVVVADDPGSDLDGLAAPEQSGLLPVSQAPVSSQLADSALSSLFDEGEANAAVAEAPQDDDDKLAAALLEQMGGQAISLEGSDPVTSDPTPSAPDVGAAADPLAAFRMDGASSAPADSGAGLGIDDAISAALGEVDGSLSEMEGAGGGLDESSFFDGLEDAGDSPPAPEGGNDPYSADATVMYAVPEELLNQAAQSIPNGAPQTSPPAAPQTNPADNDDATVIAQVPSALLAASQQVPGITNAEDEHYRDVYQEFVEARVQCGEDTGALTYQRFVKKLLKNRQQIMDKYNSDSVRFQVYIKQGKAALRAVPVRD